MKGKGYRKKGSIALQNLRQRGFPDVEKIVDANDDLEVEVTPADVSRAVRKEHRICALAVSCKRITHAGVYVGRSVCYIVRGKIATKYQLSQSIIREIVSFDRNGPFAVGIYRLKPPPEPRPYKRPSNGGGGETNGKRRMNRPRHMHFTEGVRTVLGQYVPQVLK